jgi:hypothetical protein
LMVCTYPPPAMTNTAFGGPGTHTCEWWHQPDLSALGQRTSFLLHKGLEHSPMAYKRASVLLEGCAMALPSGGLWSSILFIHPLCVGIHSSVSGTCVQLWALVPSLKCFSAHSTTS